MSRSLRYVVPCLALAACGGESPPPAKTAVLPVAEIPAAAPQEEEEAEPEPEVADENQAAEPEDEEMRTSATAAEIAEALAELDVQTIGRIGPGNAATATPSGPRGSAAVGGPVVHGGSVSNASAVVARMRARFRRCYQAQLKSDPNLKGSVKLVAHVDANGSVTQVDGTSAGLAPILPCLKAVVASGGFAPPQGGVATISIPLTFINVK